MTHRRYTPLLCAVGLCAFALSLGACAPNPRLAEGTVSADDFVAAQSPSGESPSEGQVAADSAQRVNDSASSVSSSALRRGNRTVEVLQAAVTEEPAPRLLVLAAEPDLAEAATPSEAPRVVGALVGQINGRPIYAEEVLDPIAARLRAAAREVREGQRLPRYFDEEAADAIARRLRDIVTNEIYLSEAETAIPEEQRLRALDYYRQMLRQQYISEQGHGSVEAAERWAREHHGVTLQEYVDQRLRGELIGLQIRQQVHGRIIVTWREIERAYREQYERFNPRPFARARVLVIPTRRVEERQAIEAALASGRTIGELIDDGEIRPFVFGETAGVFRVTLPSDTLADTDVITQVGYGALNEAARSLAVGETSEAIEFNEGRLVGWVRLEALEAPPAVSLYEAQQLLRQEITEQKLIREFDRFESRMLTRQDISNMRAMAEMVLIIARREFLAS